MLNKILFWICGIKECDMNWVLICSEGDVVNYVRVFNDFFDGADYADQRIRQHDPDADLPNYRANEFYRSEDLTVSLVRESVS